MKYDEVTTVYKKVQLSNDVVLLELIAPQICASAEPGQFVNVKCGEGTTLRRPLGIADVCIPRNSITVIFRLLGPGTHALASLNKGDRVDVVGPLGHGFDLSARKPLLVGGGLGLAPLLMLAKLGFGNGRADLLIGGRSATDTNFWVDLYKGNVTSTVVTTDDGSAGTKGTVMAELENLLPQDYDVVYTCGPVPMMSSVAAACAKAGKKCQVSLEKYMACGLGACLSCSMENAKGERVKVCKDGPVFWADEVKEW